MSELWRGRLVRLARACRMGVRTLWLHRLRSFLTVLGIVFGVCSVIAMLAIGEGASAAAQEQIKSLGSQNIILRSIKPPPDEKVTTQTGQFLLNFGLTYADIRAIQATIPGVVAVIPGRVVQEWVSYIHRRVDSEIVGTVPWYPEMRNHHVTQGRFFTDLEMDAKSGVCVLSSEIAEALFPLDYPLGRSVRLGSRYYQVIGVVEHRVALKDDVLDSESGSAGLANRVYVPLETLKTHYGDIIFKRRTGSREMEKVVLSEVTVKVNDQAAVVNVAQAIQALLERKHKKADYRMIVPLELLKRAAATKRIFNIVLGSIAAISLLVGGIGIMNIMLASVTERTREIGIRRAVGAKRKDIIVQFLLEAAILSGAGGLLGVAVGLAIPKLVTLFSGMPTLIAFWAPPLAFTISALVGVGFGLYPALRAAEMDPIQALRHE
ncbi:MAG: ABC transporter permease [Verrucomicrobiia bacterium]